MMVWDYPSPPPEREPIPPRDEDELYEIYRDRRMEREYERSQRG